ncbi:BamA/TamA family outer membrane protein [Propylenella binzhouense]|uniref:BamA/TamA family outer membrane protein n=1 Tax=Propylenella binzhouense TaxID=2555902 RepID=UPI001370AC0C
MKRSPFLRPGHLRPHGRPDRVAAHVGRYATVLALAILAGGMNVAPAEASFFSRLFGREEPEPVPDAQPYTLDFKVTDADLEKTLQAASNLYSERDRPPPGTTGLLARARGDYGRLLAALYREGRYGGTITILVDGRPPDSIPIDATLPDPAPVTVTVDPGPLFTFGKVRIEGAPQTVDPREEEANLDLSDLEIEPGAPARSGRILSAEQRVVTVWRQRGHPKAEIASREVVADHRTNTVDVTIVAEPGPEAPIGAVTVTGTRRMVPEFVVRQTGLKPGEPYDPDTLDKAKKRLLKLQVFSSVSIQEAEFLDELGRLPVNFALAERKRRVFGAGASYSTVDGATVETYWMHRNLFGRAESLRLEAEVSRLGSQSYDQLGYRVGATFVKPGIFDPDTDLNVSAEAKQDTLESYQERSARGEIALAHQFSDALTGKAGIAVERSRFDDAFGISNYLLVSLPAQLTFDSRNDKLNPTKGINAAIAAEPFHDLRSDATAILLDATAASYLSIDADDRFVLAGRIGLGTIAGADLREVPADRRFYLGGGGSIRGYAYRNVGPRIGDEVTGGLSYWEASLELRARVTNTIGIVPFVDAGASFEDAIPDFGEKTFVGAGIGLRYHTPIGPIRVDVARALTPQEGDPNFALYIGLGQAF